jgi:hypothetical protein
LAVAESEITDDRIAKIIAGKPRRFLSEAPKLSAGECRQ